jgi:hypothetical protein
MEIVHDGQTYNCAYDVFANFAQNAFLLLKTTHLVHVPHCTHHQKQPFRLSGLKRKSFKVTKNRAVLYAHLNFTAFTERSDRYFLSPLYDFGHVIIRSVQITVVQHSPEKGPQNIKNESKVCCLLLSIFVYIFRIRSLLYSVHQKRPSKHRKRK